MNTDKVLNASTHDEGSKPPGQDSQAAAAPTPYVGKPQDGRQFLDVIEEQLYAEQRPTAEEQRPRYSYLNLPACDKKAGCSIDTSVGTDAAEG